MTRERLDNRGAVGPEVGGDPESHQAGSGGSFFGLPNLPSAPNLPNVLLPADHPRGFLAEATAALASSALDYEGTLASIARLGLPRVADWCLVDVVEPDGSFSRASVAHVDPDHRALAEGLTGPLAPRSPAALELASVLAGDHACSTRTPLDDLGCSCDPVAHRTLLARLRGPAAACISVPLRARERTLGVLTLISIEPSRDFGPGDVTLAEQLGHVAALAMDSARLYREAQRVNRVKDEFLATLSHELRTPLNAVLGWARLLRTGRLDEAARCRAIETIERNAEAQAQLIEDLLDVSRIISGKFCVEVRPVDLRAVIEAAVEAVRLAADARGIALRPNLGADLPILAGDPTRLQQVVWNLLSNAIKFTPRGGHVDVRVHRAGGHVDIEVADDGPGIRRDFLPFVFDRFRQADGTTTRSHGGLGLGLAIVRHLVELHGGTASVESEGLGKGATFTVRLPLLDARSLTAVEPPSYPISRPAAGPVSRPSETPSPRPLEGLSVLVVDDDLDARELVSTMLCEAGAEVVTAGSADEAMAAIHARRPDVLLSDIGMPGEDGYSLLRRVRALEPTLGLIPAAALTAYASPADRSRALSAGYASHVPKPFDPQELASVVAGLAGRAR